jgi:hypothetical protein
MRPSVLLLRGLTASATWSKESPCYVHADVDVVHVIADGDNPAHEVATQQYGTSLICQTDVAIGSRMSNSRGTKSGPVTPTAFITDPSPRCVRSVTFSVKQLSIFGIPVQRLS